MRILLIGEFSRLHNSLKEGLVALGHDVVLVGSGDDFKKYPVDLSIDSKTVKHSGALLFLSKIAKKLWKFNMQSFEKGWRFKKLLPILKDFDVVQLINSDAIETTPETEIKLYEKLFAQNKKIFLLVCGDETPVIRQLLKNELKYSVVTPYLKDPDLRPYYAYSFKYLTQPYEELYDFVSGKSAAILTSDLDYKIAMDAAQINTTLIPNPVNTEEIAFEPLSPDYPIVIFYGANKYSHVKKGGKFFDEALETVKAKYGEKVRIDTVNSLPYSEYVKHLKKAHIVLDQVYAFDQGYNALEAMARGKVVFTGAESEFYEHYELSEKVAINALPDVDSIVSELSQLIENPEEILEIGKRARNFIEKEHYYTVIAQRYINLWTNS